MAAVIDAMAMRAQSCIYDSGYPDAPAAALIKSDVIGAGGLAFFSHPILNFHMSCVCFIVPSFFFTLSTASLSLLLSFFLKNKRCRCYTSLTCPLCFGGRERDQGWEIHIHMYINTYIIIWPFAFAVGKLRFRYSE